MRKLIMFIAIVAISVSAIQCKKEGDAKKTVETTAEAKHKNPEEGHIHIDDPKYVSKEVKVVGDVIMPLTLTVDSLKKMNVVELKDFKVVCQSGATTEDIKSTKGVLLKEILEKATIEQKEHKDRNFYIVARATDDYKATFSWAEIFNSPLGEQIYVLFEQNGEPLKDKGEMIVISAGDTRTGPRHVKWLKSIEVNRVK